MKVTVKISVLLAGILTSTTYALKGPSYALFRNSVFNEKEKIYIAIFNANESGTYNLENCERVARLLQNQPGVVVKFWCEEIKE